jgi:CsoR family transcriptional regulator, copper-sensing transcriptional repressor
MLNSNEKTDVIHRLKKIEGQIRGIQKMVENNTYCVDVLIQLASVRSTVTAVSKNIMKSHANSCVINAVQQGQTDIIDEMMDVIFKFSK